MANAKQPKPKSIEDDWEARHDFNVLADAEKIKSDPTRLKRAQEYGINQLQAAQRIVGTIPTGQMTTK